MFYALRYINSYIANICRFNFEAKYIPIYRPEILKLMHLDVND